MTQLRLWWKISVAEAVLVRCPECTGWRRSHVSLPWLNRAWCITPLTHDHPSFLSSSFRPKLRYPSINTKETLHHLRFGESMFRWLLRINRTRPLSTPLSTVFIVRSDEVKTCRLITPYIKTATPVFFIMGHDRAALKVQSYEACGEYLDPFPADQAQCFPCGLILHVWLFYTAMSIFAPLSPWSARQWVKYTLVFLSAGWKLLTGRGLRGSRYFYNECQYGLAENAEQMAKVVVDIKMFTVGNKHGLV